MVDVVVAVLVDCDGRGYVYEVHLVISSFDLKNALKTNIPTQKSELRICVL